MLNENAKESEFPKLPVDISKKIVASHVKIEENDTNFTTISLEDSMDMIFDFIRCLPIKYQKKILERVRDKEKMEFIKEEVEGLKDNPSRMEEESKKIDLFYRNNIGDSFNILHEIWHAIFLEKEVDTENVLLENPILLEYEMYGFLKQSGRYQELAEDLDRYIRYRYQETYQYALEILFKNDLIALYQKNQTLNRDIIERHIKQLTFNQEEYREYYEEKFNFVEGGHVLDSSLLFQYILPTYLVPTILKEEDSISKIIQISENFLTDDKILDKVIGSLEDDRIIDCYKKFHEKLMPLKPDKKRR